MKIRQLIVATLTTAALVVPTAIWAADHFGRGGMGFGMGDGPFGMGGGEILRLADKLGLSSNQVTQIKAIISAARSANQPTRDQLQANRQAFNASYNPTQFDANVVNAYIAQQTPLVQQLVVSRFQTEASVLAVLTAQQQAQLAQLRQEFKARHHWHGAPQPTPTP
jgi:Spy/CpxP family protein refolding chaperone